MAEPMDSGPTTPRSGFMGKLSGWVKKNKMIAALIAGGAALLLIKKGSGEGAHIINSEGEEEGASSIQLVPVSVSKSSAEEYERPEEPEEPLREPAEEERPVQEEKEEPAGPEPQEPPESSEPPPVTTGHGVIIHGREFPAATSFKQTRNGKDQKGTYIEYLIEFPGFTQRWHYYASSNKWIKAGDSREGGGGSKPPVASPPPKKTPPPPGNGGGGGKPGPHKPPKPTPKPKEKVGPGHPAPGGGGGGGGGGAPSCPAGTVQNIQQNRAEVQRLQGEINTLQSYIAAHPNAKQVPEWRANIAHKQQVRDACQGAVDRGRAQPGCGNV